jgi:hypothetical protein
VIYVVPADLSASPAVLQRVKQASARVQAWYQCASGGLTWEFAYSETARVYLAENPRTHYRDNNDWWGSLLSEMQSNGEPIWEPGTVTALWAHGAGFWAGAAWGCLGDCGTALLGVELFPEFNNPAYSGGNCGGGAGSGAFPCTPEGAYAHELGHALQLPHPVDVPATAAVATHSVMQTHWNFPDFAGAGDAPWGLLSAERQTIRTNPFLKQNVLVDQIYENCDVVNLPVTGAEPSAAFQRVPGTPVNVFSAHNLSTGGVLSYWSFGDHRTSNATNVSHAYQGGGTFLVRLRTMAVNGMIDEATAMVDVPLVAAAPAPGIGVGLDQSVPNPVGRGTRIGFRLAAAGRVDLDVYTSTGRHVRSLAAGPRAAGSHVLEWDGRNGDGRRVPPGLYFYRLRSLGAILTRKLVVQAHAFDP